ncbi:MAG: DUF4259 domain-containing protein [Maricaulis sp.]|uniref:DUF4259 domain-containing protein n=1 Tax=Maricaulis sp. TaxID=1486257 RepID=UPI001B165100|nr:DUF4259 domain-containing protein [Maricaulis sp.]MBO6729784.1 DUF4259 domain-containing protein [Maricaulis sp.]MBO6846599.1 DUF4259 domain-containing protein [Maricaulis sp.]MBO6877164.1 DUF4259 domain-containing protein [Maricaulis sp.]
MGAWAEDNFANDTALDWLDGQFSDDPVAAVEEAFANIEAGSEDYLDADFGCEALAAAETVAIALGQPSANEAEDRIRQIKVHAEAILKISNVKQRAASALDGVVSENSELKELWTEDGPNPAWDRVIADLRSRLS